MRTPTASEEMKTKTYQLSLQEKTRVEELLAKELNMRKEIVFAYAYGSFAEDGDLPVHDIDIGVHVAGIGKTEATPYALELGESLSKKTGIPMHVTVVNHAPILGNHSGTCVTYYEEIVKHRAPIV